MDGWPVAVEEVPRIGDEDPDFIHISYLSLFCFTLYTARKNRFFIIIFLICRMNDNFVITQFLLIILDTYSYVSFNTCV